jgi:hypothetical protein
MIEKERESEISYYCSRRSIKNIHTNLHFILQALQVVDTNVVIPGRDNKDVAIDKKSSMSTPVNQHPKRKFSDVMSVLKDFSPMLKDNKIQQDAAQDLLKSLKEEFDVTLTPQSTSRFIISLSLSLPLHTQADFFFFSQSQKKLRRKLKMFLLPYVRTMLLLNLRR